MLATMQSSSPLLPSSASAPSSAVSSLDFALDAFTADASLVFVSSGVSAVGSEIRPFLKNLSTPSVESEESVLLTRGDSSLVLESVLTLIHDEPCEWLLPGVKPTNRRLVVPLVTSTSFRDGKVASRRVYWDQASVCTLSPLRCRCLLDRCLLLPRASNFSPSWSYHSCPTAVFVVPFFPAVSSGQ